MSTEIDNKEALNQEQKGKLPELAEVIKNAQDLVAKLDQKKLPQGEFKEKMEKMEAEVARLSGELAKSQTRRKAEWIQEDAEGNLVLGKDLPKGGKSALDTVMTADPDNTDPQIAKAQEVLDRTYILSTLTGKSACDLEYFRENYRNSPVLQKAINVADLTNSGNGWQPTLFSTRMIEKVRLNLVVANLHPRFAMPADPYKFPLEGNDAVAYVVSEQGDADADLDTAKRVPTGLSSMGPANLNLSTKKIGARVTLSNESQEDSFLAIMPIIEDKLALCMAEAQENITINGDTGATLDIGGGGYGATDQRRAWNGYRRYLETLGTTKITAGTSVSVDIADIRKVRAAMGKYAIKPSDLVMITGPQGYIKLLATKDGSHPTPVLTLEKYGNQATILTGELGRLDGIPILVTEFMGPYNVSGAENLTAAGLFQGVTTSYTEILFVRPSSFLYGDRRQIQLKSKELIETDQQMLVTLQRLTFANLYSGQPVVGAIVGLSK